VSARTWAVILGLRGSTARAEVRHHVGVDRSLVRTTASALVPSGEASPEFRRYRDRTWLQVTTGTAAVTAGGIVLALVLGGTLGGLAGFVAGVSLGMLAGMWTGLHLSAVANRRLRGRLRRQLGVRGRGIFVGLRAAQGALWAELHRKETDDNVGFLEVEAQHLLITTEAGKVALRREDVRGFTRERVKAVPLLSFVRVLLDEDGVDASFLLISREGDSLKAHVEASEVLYRLLVEWHAEHQLRWLEAQRGVRP
jgi:hypothetical protein